MTEGGGVAGRVRSHDDQPGAPDGVRGADGLGGEPGRAAGGVRVPAAQPGGGDDRCAQRRGNGGGQCVQAADQQALALDLGVPERGALLAVPVDPLLHGVDVDERQRVPAGQQRRPQGQLAQQLPVHHLQLADVSPGERPQVRPERGRCPDPAEQARHRAVPQQVHVIDAVRACGHARDQARDLQLRVDAALQARQPGPLSQGHDRDQPGPRHEVRVVEGCAGFRQGMQQSDLQGVLSGRPTEALDTPIVPVQRAPFTLTRPESPRYDRWIEA